MKEQSFRIIEKLRGNLCNKNILYFIHLLNHQYQTVLHVYIV